MTKLIRYTWARCVARMEDGRSGFKILIDKHTGKKSRGSSSHKWEDNFRINLNKYVSA